jgi:hypothetical protein
VVNWYRLVSTTVMILFAACAGCNSSQQSAGQSNVTPEETYRSFMIANLSGDESAIRPLVLDHDNAEVLWQGAYPPNVAATLAEQYRTMEISRVGTPNADRVVLQSSAAPMPLTVVNVDGDWKVDAEPIIEFRKGAEELKQK